jgi:hypothetical protein
MYSPTHQASLTPAGPCPPDRDKALREALIMAARADFWCFVELMFPVLHPGQKLIFAPYLGYIATLLMRVEQGKYRRVIINLPPRHMKSILTSVLYPAWRLGRDPTKKFICISYSDDLAHDLSALTRKVMRSPLYRLVFPQSQWKSIRTSNAIERLHEEFKRRIKTQTVLPCAESAAMLFWALMASGQIIMRKVAGWQSLAVKPADQIIDLAA